jgi:hypothetical protein
VDAKPSAGSAANDPNKLLLLLLPSKDAVSVPLRGGRSRADVMIFDKTESSGAPSSVRPICDPPRIRELCNTESARSRLPNNSAYPPLF